MKLWVDCRNSIFLIKTSFKVLASQLIENGLQISQQKDHLQISQIIRSNYQLNHKFIQSPVFEQLQKDYHVQWVVFLRDQNSAKKQLIQMVFEVLDLPFKVVFIDSVFQDSDDHQNSVESIIVSHNLQKATKYLRNSNKEVLFRLRTKQYPKTELMISSLNQLASVIGLNWTRKIGYFLSEKKELQLQTENVLNSFADILFVPINFEFDQKEWLQQSGISFIIHKILDLDKPEIKKKLSTVFLENYKQCYDLIKSSNQIQWLDCPSQIEKLKNRQSLVQALESVLSSAELKKIFENYGQKLSVPRSMIAELPGNVNIKQLDQKVIENGIKYPLIIKNMMACSVSIAHKMGIAMNSEGIAELASQNCFQGQVQLQELINHNDIIFKVYIVGSEVIVQQRQSIPNIITDNNYLLFDSQHNITEQIKQYLKQEQCQQQIECDHQFLKDVCLQIGQQLGLSLFGVDFILGVDQNYYVFDVNYFPGYKKVQGLQGIFQKHVLSVFKQ